ncbi:ethanolamine permease [Emcibacter nanhaiensis]|uniref:Ethanolamine permease n=1 Tax=Emcibacter nanhaiensis TaxID=1505037 RepID=A0A501PKP0_9PROT|nr:ethanolamine permease [Emcibacter nanhaiensis]TPD60652.1 ethanolamine permease [Emcibacter nanhaiensis]
MSQEKTLHVHDADYEMAPATYMDDRSLAKGGASWVQLAALGVSCVIAGEFAAWNYGIGLAGWGGLFIALVLMALMYFCLTFSLAELSSIIPTAGGGYGFARRAFGPSLGFLTGMAVVFEYTFVTAGVALFFEGYFASLTGIDGLVVLLPLYGIFFLVHLAGAKESMRLLMLLAALATLGLVSFIILMLPSFDWQNIIDLPVADAWGASDFLPQGYLGIWAGFPFAIAMFLAVEGIPLASEEAENPRKDVPKGLIAAVTILMAFAVLILLSAPGAAGSGTLVEGADPLMIAFTRVYGPDHPLRYIINISALVGITASFFSLIFAYSRQVFALSRAGYLPRFLSVTNKRKAPYMAILVPGAIAIGLTLTRATDQIIVIVVFSATLSYLLMLAAHISLRLRERNLKRPYKTPGGLVTSGIGFLLACLAFIVCISLSIVWSITALLCLGAFMLYFWFYSRHHLVAQAPEEEFETMRAATSELDGGEMR